MDPLILDFETLLRPLQKLSEGRREVLVLQILVDFKVMLQLMLFLFVLFYFLFDEAPFLRFSVSRIENWLVGLVEDLVHEL